MERVAEIMSQDVGHDHQRVAIGQLGIFGFPNPRHPLEAVFFLGLTTIRALVLSCNGFSQFNAGSVEGFSAEQLTRHCLETAQIAKRIAQCNTAKKEWMSNVSWADC